MANRFLFLVAEMQPFLAAGLRALQRQQPEAEIIIYCRNVPANGLLNISPCNHLRIFTYDYEPEVFFWETIQDFKPQVAWCSGWMFRLYLSWAKALRKAGTKTICAMDTQWKGTVRQRLLTIVSPYTLRKMFDYAWVPGKRQEQYALKLGFPAEHVLQHLYAPDTSLFGDAYQNRESKSRSGKFLYVGRLEPHKIKNLVLAFRLLDEQERDNWHLQLIGDGSMLQDALLMHPAIEVLPAMPQPELLRMAKQLGIFCLCSSNEPWGTVAQEFAAAGFPLLLSRQCGSSDHFLDGNGVLCDGTEVNSIKKGLQSFISVSDSDLDLMSERSHGLGMRSGSDTWAATLLSIL